VGGVADWLRGADTDGVVDWLREADTDGVVNDHPYWDLAAASPG